MPKTRYTPRLPWDRAPLSPFEKVAYAYIREFHDARGYVPGKRTLRDHFGCSELAAMLCLRSLVIKGWLGEAGGAHSSLYINDEPKD